MDTLIVNKKSLLRYNTTVKVVVGEPGNSQAFYIHANILTSRSSFFRKALKGYHTQADGARPDEAEVGIHWREGETGTIILPEDDPDTFALYAHLVYNGSLPVREDTELAASSDAQGSVETPLDKDINHLVGLEQDALADIYVFSEKIQDIEAKCTVLTAMIQSIATVRADGYTSFPDRKVIATIYNGTMLADPMRQFIVDCFIVEGTSGLLGSSTRLYPHEFFHDLALGLLKYRQQPSESDRLKINGAAMYCNRIKPANDEGMI